MHSKLDQLKHQALKNICECYFYDLVNTIDDLPERELMLIIADRYHGHKQGMEHQPVPEDMELLLECMQSYEKKEAHIK